MNWYGISTYRQLATNIVGSVHKGDRVIVTGRLRIRDWESGEKRGTNIEIDADTLGHDLSWGTAAFTRSVKAAVLESFPEPAGETDPDGDAEAAPALGELPVPF